MDAEVAAARDRIARAACASVEVHQRVCPAVEAGNVDPGERASGLRSATSLARAHGAAHRRDAESLYSCRDLRCAGRNRCASEVVLDDIAPPC